MNWTPAYVGQTGPGGYAGQGTAVVDAYSYGAASQALSEGQALAAWAELSKEQNFPGIKAVAVTHTCPAGWLISPDGGTCVNIDRVHIALADKSTCGSTDEWYRCAELPLYMALNEQGALTSGSLDSVTAGALRGLRAMNMTSGNYGWKNVRSQLRALAWLLLREHSGQWGSAGSGDVDELQDQLAGKIAPSYDADIANPPQKSSGALYQPIYPTGPSPLLWLIAAAAAGTLAWIFVPGVKPAVSSLLSKGRALLPKAIRP